MKKNDLLSDALRRGDPANEPVEAQSAEARKNALLARCAAEPFAESASLPAAQTTRLPKTRWALPVFVGAGALTAAALYGMAAWFGAGNTASQTVPARIVKISPRPLATPAPRALVSESVAAQTGKPKWGRIRRDTRVASIAATDHGTHRAISVKSMRQADNLSPAPAKAIVRATRKEKAAGPPLVAVLPKSQAVSASPKTVGTVVERVIIEQDATPVETPPTPTTVAITMNGRAESVVVSRAVEPAAN